MRPGQSGLLVAVLIQVLSPIDLYSQTTDDFINGILGIVPRVYVEWSLGNETSVEESAYTAKVEEAFYQSLLSSGIEVISVYDFVGDIREANVLDCNVTVMENETGDGITEEYYTELRQLVVKWSDFANWARSSPESPAELVPYFNSTATWSFSGIHVREISDFGSEGANEIGISCAEAFIREWNRANN
ncbi:MAG: hypothetical protein CME30_04640 [Gemmatimonadetes bacterium]|uniref:Uncharacterized protein n=1 Tax=marine metagenome TaxID=408172 RepID=A0A382A5U1_9ZZZZ|nr:hypothetical protein [Gemmatimonadota bacterium]